MNVLVLSNVAPFIRGGAEELAEHLVLNLCKRPGANAELLRIPFQWDPASAIIGQILLNKSLRLANVDRVIAMKFPAYLIPHENKIIWLMHQYRQAYDLDRDGMTNIPADGDGDKIRNAIRTADNACPSPRGYSTAFAAKKCVITATDSGGLLELVKHRETGFVVSPDPAAIAVGFENVCVERRGARLGEAARDLWDRLDITWPSRIDRLLS